MCNNIEELKKLINEKLVFADGTNLTTTGWTDEGNRGDHLTDEEILNRITTGNGLVVASVTVRQDGGRGFGFSPRRANDNELTIEQVRGVLVTLLAVSKSNAGKTIAAAFASTVETLHTQCFTPVSYDIYIDAEEPTVRLTLSNGRVSVYLESHHTELDAQSIQLDLPVKYLLGHRFTRVLLGHSDSGHSTTGLTVLVDGKWKRLTGISARDVDGEDSVDKAPIDIEPIIKTLVAADKQELVSKALTALVKQLNTLTSEEGVRSSPIIFTSATARHSEHGWRESLVVSAYDPFLQKRYGFEFDA